LENETKSRNNNFKLEWMERKAMKRIILRDRGEEMTVSCTNRLIFKDEQKSMKVRVLSLIKVKRD